MITSILAVSNNNVIGNSSTVDNLPWPRISLDMKWFSSHTTKNIVVMGRNTWESLGEFAPLKNRINVVVSSNKNLKGPDIIINDNILENIKKIEEIYHDKKVFIIGGAQLYDTTIPIVDEVVLTRIYEDYEGDTVVNLDAMLENKNLLSYQKHLKSDTNPHLEFQTWIR